MPESTMPTNRLAFRDQIWQTKWLIVGMVFLALFYSTRFLNLEWLSQVPAVSFLLFAAFLCPQLFMLLFPLLTGEKKGRIDIPGVKRCLVESGIAILVAVVTLILVSTLNYFVGMHNNGRNMTSDAATGMANSPTWYMYPILLLSFTLVPFAEEVFFRGFLYNSFKTRMPTIVAGFLQSLIFGFSHFFGASHAVVAVFLGLVITAVYEWRKTLITPVFIHGCINFISAVGIVILMANYPILGVRSGPDDTDCIIREVTPDSAASESGIVVGDQITHFDGQPIANFAELKMAIATRQPGDTVTLRVVRDGEVFDLEVTLKQRSE